MAKCKKCGRGIGIFNAGVKLSGDVPICNSCLKSLGFDPKSDNPAYLRYEDIKDGRAAYDQKRAARAAACYEFNVHWDDEKIERILEKYQREYTSPEDRYDGMTKQDIKEMGMPGEKFFKYPPLDVYVELKEDKIDGKAAILVYLLDGDETKLIGYAPKTKAKKILQILSEHDVQMSAELSGGDYRELVIFNDGEAVCNSNIPKPLKVQVRLDWSSEI